MLFSRRLFLCLITIAFVPHFGRAEGVIDAAKAKADPDGSLLWYDLGLFDIEGKGWTDTKEPYDRLPAKAEALVRKEVWNLSRHSAGLCARFVTDASAVHARWTVRNKNLAMPHMPATGVSGLDLYIRGAEGHWHWIGAGKPTESPTNSASLTSGLSAGQHEFQLYLPLYNGVKSVEIGIPKGKTIAKAPARPADRRKPIIFYGTSITQGGCASRPGMAHTAIVGRRLDRPVINLGFSGNGRMEAEIAQLLAEVDAAVYVIDCVPNMSTSEVAQRSEPFVRMLLKSRPKTPVLLVEDRNLPRAFAMESLRKRQAASRAALRKTYEALIADKAGPVHYLEGATLATEDGEDTVDGSHPTDLGFLRQGQAFTKALTPILGPVAP